MWRSKRSGGCSGVSRSLLGRGAICGVVVLLGRQLVWWVGDSGRRGMLVVGMSSVGCDRSGIGEMRSSGRGAKCVIVRGIGVAECWLVVRVDGDHIIWRQAGMCRGEGWWVSWDRCCVCGDGCECG